MLQGGVEGHGHAALDRAHRVHARAKLIQGDERRDGSRSSSREQLEGGEVDD